MDEGYNKKRRYDNCFWVLVVILLIATCLVFIMVMTPILMKVASAAPLQPSGPYISSAGCNWIVVQWDDPLVMPDIMFPGMAYVHNGDYQLIFVPLDLMRGKPNFAWAGYVGDLDRGYDWIVETGFIAVLDSSGIVFFTNTPYNITCERVWLPMLAR